MAATILKIPVVAKLECSSCGAKADASCNCGAPYIPAGERAKKAVEANPEKSDRAIAAELGVGKDTVRRAREATGAHAPVDERIGLDGKVRRLPIRAEEEDEDDEIEGENDRAAFLLRVDQAARLAVYGGKVTPDLIKAARWVAEVWTRLANKMEK